MDFGVMGTIDGDLVIFRFPALYLDETEVENFDARHLRKEDMSVSKCFSAHTTMVNCIQVFGSFQNSFVFSSALQDQCII